MKGAVLLLALATSAATAQQMDPDAELHGRVAGPAVSCIDQDRAGAPLVFNPTAILFRQSGARIWRNTPETSCQALRWGVHLVMFNTGRRLCRGDRFKVIDPGSTIASGECFLGPFIPYDKVRS